MKKIILIEDEEDDFNAIKKGLEVNSFWEVIPNSFNELIPYFVSEESLKKLEKQYLPDLLSQKPFAAIIDIKITDKAEYGYRLIDIIKLENNFMPIIVLTRTNHYIMNSINHKVLYHFDKAPIDGLKQQTQNIISSLLVILYQLINSTDTSKIKNDIIIPIGNIIQRSEDRILSQLKDSSMNIKGSIDALLEMIVFSNKMAELIFTAIINDYDSKFKRNRGIDFFKENFGKSDIMEQMIKSSKTNFYERIFDLVGDAVKKKRLDILKDGIFDFIKELASNIVPEEQIGSISNLVLKTTFHSLILANGLKTMTLL